MRGGMLMPVTGNTAIAGGQPGHQAGLGAGAADGAVDRRNSRRNPNSLRRTGFSSSWAQAT